MLDLLPPELLIDILCRLSLLNLLRCTSISKSWYTLITSPNFITTHFNRTSSINRTPLLMLRRGTMVYRRLPIEQYSLHIDNDTLDEFADLQFPPISEGNSSFSVIGVCNGLVCLSGDAKVKNQIIALWNPSLRKSVSIPKPSIVHQSRFHCQNHPIGFGIDPISNDYKIVRLTYLLRLGTILEPITPPLVELFELSTGVWRKINISGGDFPYVIFFRVQPVFFKGFVHWTGYERKSTEVDGNIRTLIVTFNMRKNTLGVLMGPPNYVRKYFDWRMRVGVFGELLSFIDFDGNSSWCLWVMKQYGVVSSWTKHCNIDLGMDFSGPVCFRQNGDILGVKNLRYHRGSMLAYYNSQSQLIKNLDVRGTVGSFYVDTYNESLVLVKGLNEVLGRQSEGK